MFNPWLFVNAELGSFGHFSACVIQVCGVQRLLEIVGELSALSGRS